MFLKFILESFADGALVEGLKVFKTKILIYQAWEFNLQKHGNTGLEGTTKLWSCVLQSQYSRLLVESMEYLFSAPQLQKLS